MKVVLFCGGLGMRLREYSESIPKPMVKIGHHPILWHIMKYYSHFGHKDFILCLGWRGNTIKEYFQNNDKDISNDFIPDTQDWNITFVDTGTTSKIGQRLKAVEKHLHGEEAFLANYTDGLTDFHLPNLIDFHREKNSIGTFLSVKPKYNSFHSVKVNGEGRVHEIRSIHELDVWMNGGFFMFTPEIFDYIRKGEELVEEPFQRLIEEQKLCTYKHEGFWCCMDTFKEKQTLEDLFMQGNVPWEMWNHSPPGEDQKSVHHTRPYRNNCRQPGPIPMEKLIEGKKVLC